MGNILKSQKFQPTSFTIIDESPPTMKRAILIGNNSCKCPYCGNISQYCQQEKRDPQYTSIITHYCYFCSNSSQIL